MLQRLTIKNFALISKLDIDFCNQLNVLSGETGAGKSIIVDCIMLLCGARYDKTMLRFGETQGFVEGVFVVPASRIDDYAEYLDEGEDVLIVNRKFTVEGRNEIRINGRTVTLSMLKGLIGELIDICGQNEHQSLANIANHIKIIDYYVRHSTVDLFEKISTNYAILREVLKKLEDIGDAKSRAVNIDIYKYQLDEIVKAKIKEDEEEELLSLRKRMLGAEKICSALSSGVALLYDDELNAIDQIKSVASKLSAISQYDEKYIEWSDRLKSASAELVDIAESVRDELDNFEFSANDLDKIEGRLETIKRIKRKYGTFSDIEKLKIDLREKIDAIENADALYEKLLKEKESCLDLLYADCVKLSSVRKQGAVQLKQLVETELSDLGMENSVFEVKFEDLPSRSECEKYVSQRGFDVVEFYLSPNVGQPVKPLVKIISGGELSRLMLALKVVSSAVDETPTVIFDEIDTGISGRVGQEIAKKLAKLSRGKQLLCVTHLPQIASMADNHYFINKKVENGQTYTVVSLLTLQESIDEIARLSGGKDIAGASIENATQMKAWSDEYKK